MALERCLAFCAPGGMTALVLPQNWLFLTSYTALRQKLLRQETWHWVARLGPSAFETISGEVVKAILTVIERSAPEAVHVMRGIDVSAVATPESKATQLLADEIKHVAQAKQLENPDARMALEEFEKLPWLSEVADYDKGSTTGDSPRFLLNFWELPKIQEPHVRWLNSPIAGQPWSGRSQICTEPIDSPILTSQLGCWLHGQSIWGRRGVVVNKMRDLAPFLCSGEVFDDNICPICPHDESLIPAIWAFVESGEYQEGVRAVDQALKVTAGTLTKVPFDLAYWTQVAAERYPDGLPPPFANDPTQWLFGGYPAGSSDPLQVAVARLLGYRWPENGADDLDAFADGDGIVCLVPVAGEQPVHERLRGLLAHAYTHPPQLPDFERYRVGNFVPATPVPRTRAGRLPRSRRSSPPRATPGRRWNSGCATASSSSTAAASTTAPLSGISGTGARMASPHW